MQKFLLCLLIYYVIGIVALIGKVIVWLSHLVKTYGMRTIFEFLDSEGCIPGSNKGDTSNTDTKRENIFYVIKFITIWPTIIIDFNKFEQDIIKEIEEYLKNRA